MTDSFAVELWCKLLTALESNPCTKDFLGIPISHILTAVGSISGQCIFVVYSASGMQIIVSSIAQRTLASVTLSKLCHLRIFHCFRDAGTNASRKATRYSVLSSAEVSTPTSLSFRGFAC